MDAQLESGLVLRGPGVIAPLDSALLSQSIKRHGYGARLNSMGLFSEDVKLHYSGCTTPVCDP